MAQAGRIEGGAAMPLRSEGAGSAANAHANLWVALVVRGALAIALGILAFFFPLTTLFAVAFAIAVIAFADGILSIFDGATRASAGETGAWKPLARGGVGIVVALFFFAMPIAATFGFSAAVLLLLAGWAILTGAADIIVAVRLRRQLASWAVLLAWGFLLLALGLLVPLILASSPESFIGLAWVIGILGLFAGVTLISKGLSLRDLVKSAGERSSGGEARADRREASPR